MASGSESVSCGSQVIEEPQTLKDALDFLAALGNNQTLVTQVAKKLSEKAGMYFNKHLLTGGAYHINRRLSDALKAANNVRDAIVHIGRKSYYGKYHDFIFGDGCISTCVTFLLNLLPTLHATLYYLYFQCNSGFNSRQGGAWSTYKFNSTDDALCEWLTANTSGAGSAIITSNAALLPGGYSNSELSRKRGSIMAGELSELLDADYGDGPLPDILLVLFFDAKFSHASTAAALSFIKSFCTAVANDTFDAPTQQYLPLKSICTKLLSNLEHLTAGPVSSTTPIVSIFKGNDGEYKQLIRTDLYGVYVDRLKYTLPKLLAYLIEMSNEVKQWYPSSFHNTTVVGPFTYGFVFSTAWSTESNLMDLMPNIHGSVSTLIGDDEPSTEGTLSSLWKCIDPGQYKRPITSEEAKPTIKTITQQSGGAPAPEAATEVSNVAKKEVQVKTVPPILTTSGEEGRTTEPAAATQSPSVSSSSSGSELSGASGSSTQHNEHTTPASDTSSHSTGSQVNSPSGTTSSASCPPADACSENHEGGSTGVVITSSPESHHADAGSKNTQSTITIGGATGGVAVLGGGCAALYFLNVGGIKTLITGVP
ncbi:secreted antigen 1 [Babesia caballi]|uniref:Secreted antigen 1 n=1 Tax=Babesia caballi TaxID=5871 RepID=A0AAV4LTA1_BABCB|nr:secreted antigen 1 [Babesia caballi]